MSQALWTASQWLVVTKDIWHLYKRKWQPPMETTYRWLIAFLDEQTGAMLGAMKISSTELITIKLFELIKVYCVERVEIAN